MMQHQEQAANQRKPINLAIQGGGSHGAYAWGILDQLLEDGRLAVEGITATSAGTMNALAYAHGLLHGGREGARQALHDFWQAVARRGVLNPVRRTPLDVLNDSWNLDASPTFYVFDGLSRTVSPYQWNPLNINPLRTILAESIDFDALRSSESTKLFISATAVRTGKVRVFHSHELSVEVALASACLPFLFQSVQIGDDYYWDGGYAGNPALFPLFYHTASDDVIVLHINPLDRPELPTSAAAIMNRVNEITFNDSLLKEMRAIAFVNKLLDNDMLKPEHREQYKRINLHSIRADRVLRDLSVPSKFNTEWAFLCYLRDLGRAMAERWLATCFDRVGRESTVDLHGEFLDVDTAPRLSMHEI